MSSRIHSEHIPDYQIEMAQQNIDMTLEILRAAPDDSVNLDTIVFPMMDRKHLEPREHVQILALTIGCLFVRLAAAIESPQ